MIKISTFLFQKKGKITCRIIVHTLLGFLTFSNVLLNSISLFHIFYINSSDVGLHPIIYALKVLNCSSCSGIAKFRQNQMCRYIYDLHFFIIYSKFRPKTSYVYVPRVSSARISAVNYHITLTYHEMSSP